MVQGSARSRELALKNRMQESVFSKLPRCGRTSFAPDLEPLRGESGKSRHRGDALLLHFFMLFCLFGGTGVRALSLQGLENLGRLRIDLDSNRRYMAEGEGFEPPVPFRVQRFSRPPVSTAHPSLRIAESTFSLPYFMAITPNCRSCELPHKAS